MTNDEDTGWSGAGWLGEEPEPKPQPVPTDDTKLAYHGKQMAVAPINTTMEVIASELLKGHPALAILEPGDGTRYELMLVPCWSSNIRLGLASSGIRPDKASDYLFVAKVNGIQGSFFADPYVQEYDAETLHNPWSCRLVSWWLRRLWVEIKRRS